MAVRCGIYHFLSLCMCADGCGRVAISRQKPYSLSVLQCIERTGLANSCKSFRVPPCKSVTVGTEAHFSNMNVRVKTFAVFVCTHVLDKVPKQMFLCPSTYKAALGR